MENYTSAKDTYIQRMNQTAKSKFEVIAGYLKPSMKVLDFGSGISALKNTDNYRHISLLSYFSHVRLQMYSHILERVMTVTFS